MVSNRESLFYMEKPSPSAPSKKKSSLEEELSRCVEKIERKTLISSCDRGAQIESASMFCPCENPRSGNEASPGLHHERGFKSNSPRGANEKMGPRCGAVSKHSRQQRQTSKGPVKVVSANESNFKDLVFEHTSKRTPPSCMVDVPAPRIRPHTPMSTGDSSSRGLMSQPTSPITPNSNQSGSASPLSSPHSSPFIYINHYQQSIPSSSTSPLTSPHTGSLNVPYVNPLQYNIPACAERSSYHGTHGEFTLSDNTSLNQGILGPRCASMPCLGNSNNPGNVSPDDGQPHGKDPALHLLENFLFDSEFDIDLIFDP